MRHTLKSSHWLASLAAAALFAPAAHATLVFNLDTAYGSGHLPGGTGPYATITVTDVSANKVNIRVDHLSTSGIEAGRYISEAWLNMDPFVASIVVSNHTFNGSQDNFSSLDVSLDGVGGGGGDLYDLGINFQTAGSGGGAKRLKQGQYWAADFTGNGLSEANFREWNNNFHDAGAHFQALGDGSSVFLTTAHPVPEPATLLALALGASAAFARRRR